MTSWCKYKIYNIWQVDVNANLLYDKNCVLWNLADYVFPLSIHVNRAVDEERDYILSQLISKDHRLIEVLEE